MSDIEKPRETYRRLAAIAENTAATDSERESARRLMARYIARYGSEVEIPEAEPTIMREVIYGDPRERLLSIHCARFSGAESFRIGRHVGVGTKRARFKDDGKTTRFEGPESAVLSAVELYEYHRAIVKKLLDLTDNGYRFGAMPLPASKQAASDDSEDEPLSREMAAALCAAAKAGAASSYTKRLGSKR